MLTVTLGWMGRYWEERGVIGKKEKFLSRPAGQASMLPSRGRWSIPIAISLHPSALSAMLRRWTDTAFPIMPVSLG